MKKSLKLFLISCIGFGLAGLSYAEDSTLKIENNAKGIKAEIAVDLLCVVSRPTSSLDENPILTGKPKTATWKSCTPAKKEFFARNGHDDHSKIYVKLIDEKTGEYYGTVINMSEYSDAKQVIFNNRKFTILMKHEGNYEIVKVKRGETQAIYGTHTLIRIDG
jgi:hypothetical protein